MGSGSQGELRWWEEEGGQEQAPRAAAAAGSPRQRMRLKGITSLKENAACVLVRRKHFWKWKWSKGKPLLAL